VFLVRNKANGKRTAGGNEEGAKPAKMSNAATINYNERKELEDPNGLGETATAASRTVRSQRSVKSWPRPSTACWRLTWPPSS
jgi:hypothetical protein